MELIPKSFLKKLPPLYSQGDKSPQDIKVVLRLFSPWGAMDWYIFEYDPVGRIANALVRDGDYAEIGLVSIDELEQIGGPLSLKIERAKYWDTNTRLSKIIARYE
jgi:hypothetical protein